MHACFRDDFDIVRILRGYKADFNQANAGGSTALHIACGFSKNKELMNYLVENGADVDKVTSNRYTILHFAAQFGNISGMEFSISRGVDVNSPALGEIGTPIVAALATLEADCDREPLDYLHSVGADLNTRNFGGATLLHVAVVLGKSEGVKFCLESGLKVGARNDRGYNSLNCARVRRGLQRDEDLQDIIIMLQEAYRKELPRCRLCGDEPAHVYFKPCHHQVSCIGCSEKWAKCLCTADIEAKTDVIEEICIDEKVGFIDDLEDKICGVCLDGNKEVVFNGCGHTACFQCSRSLVKCHVCRSDIPRKLELS